MKRPSGRPWVAGQLAGDVESSSPLADALRGAVQALGNPPVGLTPSAFEELDEWLRRRLWQVRWKEWKALKR
ncbi:MAG TPA: group II intron maturase-specific domain-containing protein [Solirubrobacterales bacterium]|nr:group II intron maturase-specific domain-containing protein [Solirubrobacterales bacterium]